MPWRCGGYRASVSGSMPVSRAVPRTMPCATMPCTTVSAGCVAAAGTASCASASATAASAAATTASASATPSTPAASTAAAASTSNRRAGCCDDQCRYESYRNELGYFRHDDLLSLFNLAGDRVQCVRPNCVPFCRANWFAKRGVQQKLIGGLAELKVLGMAPEMSEAAIASFRWQSEHERNPDERS
jgi:hypothetical protein